ncbi:MAG: AAA family ATPase [Candidatus Omnitrophota bacterium]|nr:AAA family ATPase [Candidatus Omnitrophota bacterium]
MYFKKLELVGFKSFYDKTALHFEQGVSAVVGPNGCGKSNLIDSIRWVLGEQSAKSLRGSEMQDVIFNGTDSKESLGLAEVTLTFDNQARFFNLDHPEVAITRKLFRSGESEYLLNKTQVRLKDILDLLSGTGIGAESYSIVAQGKIDLVLSSRPEDRRLVFDEAAGITKYKSQKRETQRKLEETEQNLLRVNDIVIEVKRQISSLERQASKARRYKEVFEELKEKEINLTVLQKHELLKNKEGLISLLGQLESEEAALLEALKAEESATASRQNELKSLEEAMLKIKNKTLGLENEIARAEQHINFNRERLIELEASRKFYENQVAQLNFRLRQDEEKLNSAMREFSSLSQNITDKSTLLAQNEARINELADKIKGSLDAIAASKREIMNLATKISRAKNEISGFQSQQQVYLARLRRLEIEKSKAHEEKMIIEHDLRDITAEVHNLKNLLEALNLKIADAKKGLEVELAAIAGIDSDILKLEQQRLGMASHKEFLEKLKTKYEDIGEAMNAVIYLDKPPAEKISGLVVKVRESAGLKFSGEAKPIELDTQKIELDLQKLQNDIALLKNEKEKRETQRAGLNASLLSLQQELRLQELAYANKDTSRQTVQESFNRIQEEEDVIGIELADVQKEVGALEINIQSAQGVLNELHHQQRQVEDLIAREEDNVSQSSQAREHVLVAITQARTELEALKKEAASEEETLKALQETLRQDEESLLNVEQHIAEARNKQETMEAEISGCEKKIQEAREGIKSEGAELTELEIEYRRVSDGSGELLRKIEQDRLRHDDIKNKLYQLQMQNKDIDHNYSSLRERILQAYKIDLDSLSDVLEGADALRLPEEINQLKIKLDSYGSVNLVAIEEYDELKKRYDFLIEQQNDLSSAKESLHQAILKINRTTKQMFLETFEQVRAEFRNYFRLLFNGGDAQVFLIDENDPLESGIEIICRPPGKKLQNVLLLSGGEKSMSAIALIFAIFKVKPAPFCILDEIDAALDEANVSRFSNLLQEFAKTSQFIVITHNKRTIANASVMYGITMEESGISKIVSVKFSKEEPQKTTDQKLALPEAA